MAEQYYQAYSHDSTMKKHVEPCSLKELFRFADRNDFILMLIGTIFSLANGVSLIFYAMPFGQLVQAFAPNKDPQEIVEDALNSVRLFLINSVIVFLNSWFMSAAWTITSERQMIRARKAYFSSLMEQQIAWHDRNRPAEACSKMYLEISKVHQGLVNNVTSVLTKVSMGLSGILIALIRGWQMALVMLAFLPLMIVSGLISSYYLKKIQNYNQKTKAKFDSEVIEVFDNVRTVRMLDGEQYEISRFQVEMRKSEEECTKNGIKNKLSFSLFFFCILMNYSLGFWYGAILVADQTINTSSAQPYSVADVIIVFFTLYMSNLSLAGLPESVTSFNISRCSMSKVCNLVNRSSRVVDGTQAAPKNINQIVFKQVNFQYDKPLFKDFSLTIKPGMTALIGESGSGKTTILSLIMRFYDIFGGTISFSSNGSQYDISKLTNQSIRDRVGYVGQQPVLIGKTLKQALNAENVEESQIIKLLKLINAWDFVKDIGLDSEFSQLSGGQKQRIAITRALIKKPQILILDEGTSALDRTTQQNVLNSIRKLQIPFVIMIAHRMETILNCNNIIKIDKGTIVASGNYSQLIEQGVLEKLDIEENMIDNKQEEQKLELEIKMKEEKKKEEIMKQIQKDEKEEKKEEEEKQNTENQKVFHLSYICRLMKFNSEHWYLYLIGIIGSLFIGAIFPTFAYLLSNIIVTLSGVKHAKTDQELEGYQTEVRALSLSLFMISVGSLLIVALRGVSLTHLTQTLGSYLKKKSFKVAINKPMIELDEYGAQHYAHIVTTNCEDLKYLGGHHIGDMLQNIITVAVGLAIAFAFSWQITLISLVVFPLIILSGKLKMAFDHGMQSNTDKVHKKTHELVIQSVMYIKTVKSLHLQQKIINKYDESLQEALRMSIKYGNLSGIMFGIGQTLISCLLALIFYFGALLIRAGQVDVLSLYTSIYAIMFAGVQAGGNLYFLSRLALAKMAACNYFQMIENNETQIEPSIYISNNRMKSSNQQHRKRIKGEISLNNIEFKYPSRDTPIFKDFSLKINRGEKVALVGESGSGKSTITNLIFRIYDPSSGQILVDGDPITSYNIGELRRQIGIVSQQPILFNRSVYQNIKYNCKNAKFQDVLAASKMSKAYDFICQGNFGINDEEEQTEPMLELQQKLMQSQLSIEKGKKKEDEITIPGFKKKVGTRGSYLSGGQKQRIAIARALIRNPSVIVLDEATSALDNQNQKMVQEAIESIHGATQIVIAHRLSTVQNCDKIFVMRKGEIMEQGRYNELLKQGGYFYKLINAIKDEDEKQSSLKND